MHRPARLVLTRESEARDLLRAVLIEQHHVIAVGGAFPIAVSRLGLQDALVGALLEKAGGDRTQFLARPNEIFVELAAFLAIAPVELIEHALVRDSSPGS